jgi:Secretion system C-terminal sorting domain
MKKYFFALSLIFLFKTLVFSQNLVPKQAYSLNVKQIHSGHSLTDPLFYPHWPGQFVNLMGIVTGTPAWQLMDKTLGKSTGPGSSIKYRWENPIGFGAPDARKDIANWELLCITERVPLLYDGGNTQQWYLDGIKEQRNFLSQFVNNAWTNGNKGSGAPTLLWTTWVNIDGSNGSFRQMLDIQGKEWEAMQDFANKNKPTNAPSVYLIPGHKMMARLYDDIQAGKVPGITNISQFFGDNIHTNELGAYAIALIHYACIFNKNPSGLTNNLLPNPPSGTPIPSQALATYLQNMIWEVVTNYPRTGIKNTISLTETNLEKGFEIYPNPASDILQIKTNYENEETYQIFNSLGKHILTSQENSIDISHLSNGYYLVKVGNEYKKFIKN